MSLDDDLESLFDLHAVMEALDDAMRGLRKAMETDDQTEREQFVFQVRHARARLQRVSERSDRQGQ